MLSWLFKKGISTHIKKELTPMNKALESSFKKIKEEFFLVHKRVDSHHENHGKLMQKLELIELRLLNLERKQPIKELSEEDEEEIEIKPLESEWNSLTDLQKSMIEVMAKLHTEGGKRWIPLRQLTEEIYPNKEYHKVRPLVSSYASILIEYDLIKKKRVGKQLFVALSKKSFKYLRDYLKSKKLLKLLAGQ